MARLGPDQVVVLAEVVVEHVDEEGQSFLLGDDLVQDSDLEEGEVLAVEQHCLEEGRRDLVVGRGGLEVAERVLGVGSRRLRVVAGSCCWRRSF